MQRKKPKSSNVIVIRKSCITGKAVWIYQGSPSKKAEWMAYDRARREEMIRVKKWKRVVERRKKNIKKLLDDCMANVSLAGHPEKKAAVRILQTLSEEEIVRYDGFYNHILEERRRRNAGKKRCKALQRKRKIKQKLC